MTRIFEFVPLQANVSFTAVAAPVTMVNHALVHVNPVLLDVAFNLRRVFTNITVESDSFMLGFNMSFERVCPGGGEMALITRYSIAACQRSWSIHNYIFSIKY